MYVLLRTNYSNYIAFDEALTLLDRFKKTMAKITKGVTYLKQPLENLLFKMLCLSSFILLAGLSSIKLLLVKSIAYPGIYTSNFSCPVGGTKTQSSNRVFKLNLRKIYLRA